MQNKQAQMRENKLSLARLDNTAGKGSRGPNRVNLDVSPQTYAYKTVCTVDTAETRLARKSARALVVLLREKNDRQPSRKFVEGMLRKGYCVPDSRIPHAVRIVYATLNKDLEKV